MKKNFYSNFYLESLTPAQIISERTSTGGYKYTDAKTGDIYFQPGLESVAESTFNFVSGCEIFSRIYQEQELKSKLKKDINKTHCFSNSLKSVSTSKIYKIFEVGFGTGLNLISLYRSLQFYRFVSLVNFNLYQELKELLESLSIDNNPLALQPQPNLEFDSDQQHVFTVFKSLISRLSKTKDLDPQLINNLQLENYACYRLQQKLNKSQLKSSEVNLTSLKQVIEGLIAKLASLQLKESNYFAIKSGSEPNIPLIQYVSTEKYPVYGSDNSQQILDNLLDITLKQDSVILFSLISDLLSLRNVNSWLANQSEEKLSEEHDLESRSANNLGQSAFLDQDPDLVKIIFELVAYRLQAKLFVKLQQSKDTYNSADNDLNLNHALNPNSYSNLGLVIEQLTNFKSQIKSLLDHSVVNLNYNQVFNKVIPDLILQINYGSVEISIQNNLRNFYQQFDFIFLDGFDPKKDSALWSHKLFAGLSHLAADSARLATFTAASEIKKKLELLGWQTQKEKGFHKREKLVANYRNTDIDLANQEQPTILVPSRIIPLLVAARNSKSFYAYYKWLGLDSQRIQFLSSQLKEIKDFQKEIELLIASQLELSTSQLIDLNYWHSLIQFALQIQLPSLLYPNNRFHSIYKTHFNRLPKILIKGMGVAGVSVANYLKNLNLTFTITDKPNTDFSLKASKNLLGVVSNNLFDDDPEVNYFDYIAYNQVKANKDLWYGSTDQNIISACEQLYCSPVRPQPNLARGYQFDYGAEKQVKIEITPYLTQDTKADFATYQGYSIQVKHFADNFKQLHQDSYLELTKVESSSYDLIFDCSGVNAEYSLNSICDGGFRPIAGATHCFVLEPLMAELKLILVEVVKKQRLLLTHESGNKGKQAISLEQNEEGLKNLDKALESILTNLEKVNTAVHLPEHYLVYGYDRDKAILLFGASHYKGEREFDLESDKSKSISKLSRIIAKQLSFILDHAFQVEYFSETEDIFEFLESAVSQQLQKHYYTATAGVRLANRDRLPAAGLMLADKEFFIDLAELNNKKYQGVRVLQTIKDLKFKYRNLSDHDFKKISLHNHNNTVDQTTTYMLSGLGGRGLTYAPILAIHVVHQALGLVSPLPDVLQDKLFPQRQILKHYLFANVNQLKLEV